MKSGTKSTRAGALDRGRHQYSCLYPADRVRILSAGYSGHYFPGSESNRDGHSQIEIWPESSSFKLIGESGEYWRTLGEILVPSKIVGPKVHDARIAAICRVHGVRELWSADRDFSRIRGVKIINPVLA